MQNNKELQKEITELEKKCEEYLNGWKRAKADYINFKKEVGKEKEEWIKFANSVLILQLLPILDNFEKAFRKPQATPEWIKGIKQIKNQLEDLLKSLGVEEIKAEGEKFNPRLHEAVGREKGETRSEKGKVREERGEERVVRVIEPGYTMHGLVIKPAKVIVN